jgi:hypothetical protein
MAASRLDHGGGSGPLGSKSIIVFSFFDATGFLVRAGSL